MSIFSKKKNIPNEEPIQEIVTEPVTEEFESTGTIGSRIAQGRKAKVVAGTLGGQGPETAGDPIRSYGKPNTKRKERVGNNLNADAGPCLPP